MSINEIWTATDVMTIRKEQLLKEISTVLKRNSYWRHDS